MNYSPRAASRAVSLDQRPQAGFRCFWDHQPPEGLAVNQDKAAAAAKAKIRFSVKMFTCKQSLASINGQAAKANANLKIICGTG